MRDQQCVTFLQWALPRLGMRWPGFRKVRGQVCKRLNRRMEELGIADVESYRVFLEANEGEWAELDHLLRIPISRFYRDRGLWSFLESDVMPMLAGEAETRAEKELRVWSIGGASGEEPYSLSILWQLSLAQRFPECRLRILATDIDEHILNRARRGCYSSSSLKNLPADWIKAAFAPGEELCIRDEFRRVVAFRLADIRTDLPDDSFDLILCRNLAFTYFDEELQKRVLKRILTRLSPGGVLVLGKKERLPRVPEGPAPWQESLGVYRSTTSAQPQA